MSLAHKKTRNGRIDFFSDAFATPCATLAKVPGGWVLSVFGEIEACFPHFSEADAIVAATQRILGK